MIPDCKPNASLSFLIEHFNQLDFNLQVQNRNLLPVLGLCAPNSKLMESSQRNTSKSSTRRNKHGPGLEFPFHLAPCSGPGTSSDIDGKPYGTIDTNIGVPPFNPVCSLLQNREKIINLPFFRSNFLIG